MLITVLKHASLGPLLNHSSKNQNCAIIRIYVGGLVRILIYTVKKIKKGEELCYNYNSGSSYYPIDF